ncbi:MAG TPA: hypothetical protein VKV27_16775 [Solirubrobacteraceae bacterium]|nr:hypothetical protein [Solirubrobacteraceae bacterium]
MTQSRSQPLWWQARRAQNLKPATYRCPLCGELLPAISEHMLLLPEGDASRRRHAHTACVLRARRAGELPTREEWERSRPERPGSARPERPGSPRPERPGAPPRLRAESSPERRAGVVARLARLLARRPES